MSLAIAWSQAAGVRYSTTKLLYATAKKSMVSSLFVTRSFTLESRQNNAGHNQDDRVSRNDLPSASATLHVPASHWSATRLFGITLGRRSSPCLAVSFWQSCSARWSSDASTDRDVHHDCYNVPTSFLFRYLLSVRQSKSRSLESHCLRSVRMPKQNSTSKAISKSMLWKSGSIRAGQLSNSRPARRPWWYSSMRCNSIVPSLPQTAWVDS